MSQNPPAPPSSGPQYHAPEPSGQQYGGPQQGAGQYGGPQQGGQQYGGPQDAKARAKADKAYRKASRPWYKKKRFILLLLLAAIITIAVATGGGGEDGATTTTEEAAAPSGAASEAPAEVAPAFPGATENDVVAQAGEQVDADGVQITAGPLTAGDDTFQKTLCSTVSYNNGSGEPASFNGAFDWKLQDPNGVILMNTFGGSDNALNSGELAPGGTLTADVCFTAPATQTPGQYVVLLDPAFSFSSDRIAWLNTL